VVAHVTALDGLHLLLFHVEQQTGWFWRWRMLGDLPSPYLRWRSGKAGEPLIVIQPEKCGATVEVQWRSARWEKWSQSALHVLCPHKVEMEVAAVSPTVLEAGQHQVLARVRGGVARYFFKTMSAEMIRPGRSITVTAYADLPSPANILFEAGEFTSLGGPLTVRNLAPSASWSESLSHWGPSKLTEVEGVRDRNLFAYHH